MQTSSANSKWYLVLATGLSTLLALTAGVESLRV